MPLTSKGREILANMRKQYGSEKKAKEVLYASKNAGRITGIDQAITGVVPSAAQMKSGDPISMDAASIDRIRKRKAWDTARPALTAWRDEIVKAFPGKEFTGEKGKLSSMDKRRSTLARIYDAYRLGRQPRQAIADCVRDCTCGNQSGRG